MKKKFNLRSICNVSMKSNIDDDLHIIFINDYDENNVEVDKKLQNFIFDNEIGFSEVDNSDFTFEELCDTFINNKEYILLGYPLSHLYISTHKKLIEYKFKRDMSNEINIGNDTLNFNFSDNIKMLFEAIAMYNKDLYLINYTIKND